MCSFAREIYIDTIIYIERDSQKAVYAVFLINRVVFYLKSKVNLNYARSHFAGPRFDLEKKNALERQTRLRK